MQQHFAPPNSPGFLNVKYVKNKAMSNNNNEELDEAKAEIEKLKAELRGKTVSLKKLKKSHDAKVYQIHKAISRVEKLEQELFQKADEIIYTQKIYEDHRWHLNNEESNTTNLSVVNDKHGEDCDEKFEKCEDEKRRLVLVLEEENQKVKNQERQEVECLSVSNRCIEISTNLGTSKDLEERNYMFQKLEGDNMKVEEQLKWKKDQFEHQQEVHENQFKSGTKGWELEKSALLEQISSLQSKLGRHIRMSQDLQHQLEMCQNAKLQLDSLNSQQEKDIEDLRHALETQETSYNESKCSVEKLEQENNELKKSIRELQEAKVREAKASYSLSVLRSNLRGLEQTYRECVAVFKARQAEWSFLKSQLTGTIGSCQSELETKAATIEELKMELECSHSLTTELMLQNEEMSVMLLVLKQGISVAQLKCSNENKPHKHKEMLEESTKCQMEIDFKEKLKETYDALDKANTELDEMTCERSEMEFELQMWKSIVERLKDDLEENLVKRQALEYSLIAQIEFSEIIKHDKDELVCELEEEENLVNDLQHQVSLLEQEQNAKEIKASVSARRGTFVSSEAAERRYLQIIKEKDKNLEELEKEVLILEQESFRREFECAVIERGIMERINELEKEKHFQFIKGKSMTISELMQQATSIEKEFISSLIPFTSQLAEKQAEISLVQEACDKITEAEALAALEIEEKKLMIEELEDDIHDMEEKLKLQEENWSQLKHLALDIEMEMDEKQLKVKELSDQMENKLRGSDVLLQKIKMENRNLLENSTTRLSSPERENLLGFVLGLSDKMSECTTADTRLIDVLRNLVQSFEKDCVGMNFSSDDGLLVKQNMIVHSPRSPFKEINN